VLGFDGDDRVDRCGWAAMDTAIRTDFAQTPPNTPWYRNGTVWTVIGVGVAVLLGVITVWAQFRSARPRRRRLIFYKITTQAPRLRRITRGPFG
jgi:hypothetical protein